MRLLALCSLLAVVAQPSLCERRNYATCSNDSGFECAAGTYCDIPTGQTVGSCVPNQCTTSNNTCPSAMPICSGELCAKCQSDLECKSLNPATPLCDPTGICVSCRSSSSDCTADPTKPVCDPTTHSCRACQLHSECASGVCAKDNSFAGLQPTPIPQGSCASSSQVNVCDSTTMIMNVVAQVSPTRPYVLIKSLAGGGRKMALAMLPQNVPTFYIIGPTADTAPSQITTAPASFSGTTAVSVSAGVNAVLEGVIIDNSQYGLECLGGPANVTLRRSYIGAITGTGSVPIQAYSGCNFTIDSSWIGKGPKGTPLGGPSGASGNENAMQLDGTSLTMVNSVLWHNGSGAFGGISLSNSANVAPAPVVRFINSSFIDQSFPDTMTHTLAIDCQNTLSVSIVNTQFLNSATVNAPTTFVSSSCGASLSGVASSETDLLPTMGVGGLLDSNVLVDPGNGDLHFGSSAPASVTSGGVLSFSDAAGTVPIPTVDMEGTPRGQDQGQISIGAFEVKR